jgi:hypothetical protein
MDTIRTTYLERVEKLWHIVPPWMINGTASKTTMQGYLLMLSTEFRDEDFDSDWPFMPAH